MHNQPSTKCDKCRLAKKKCVAVEEGSNQCQRCELLKQECPGRPQLDGRPSETQHKSTTTAPDTRLASADTAVAAPILQNPVHGQDKEQNNRNGALLVEEQVRTAFLEFARTERAHVKAGQDRSGSQRKGQTNTLDSLRKSAQTYKMEDFKRFSATFKLKSPVPSDMLSILAKDPAKQEQIVQKVEQDRKDAATPRVKKMTDSMAPNATIPSSSSHKTTSDLDRTHTPTKNDLRRTSPVRHSSPIAKSTIAPTSVPQDVQSSAPTSSNPRPSAPNWASMLQNADRNPSTPSKPLPHLPTHAGNKIYDWKYNAAFGTTHLPVDGQLKPTILTPYPTTGPPANYGTYMQSPYPGTMLTGQFGTFQTDPSFSYSAYMNTTSSLLNPYYPSSSLNSNPYAQLPSYTTSTPSPYRPTYGSLSSYLPYTSMRQFSGWIEYYLSPDYLGKSMFLRRYMDTCGFISIEILTNLPELKALVRSFTSEPDKFRAAIYSSSKLQIMLDSSMRQYLRIKDGWQQFVLPVSDRFFSARRFRPPNLVALMFDVGTGDMIRLGNDPYTETTQTSVTDQTQHNLYTLKPTTTSNSQIEEPHWTTNSPPPYSAISSSSCTNSSIDASPRTSYEQLEPDNSFHYSTSPLSPQSIPPRAGIDEQASHLNTLISPPYSNPVIPTSSRSYSSSIANDPKSVQMYGVAQSSYSPFTALSSSHNYGSTTASGHSRVILGNVQNVYNETDPSTIQQAVERAINLMSEEGLLPKKPVQKDRDEVARWVRLTFESTMYATTVWDGESVMMPPSIGTSLAHLGPDEQTSTSPSLTAVSGIGSPPLALTPDATPKMRQATLS